MYTKLLTNLILISFPWFHCPVILLYFDFIGMFFMMGLHVNIQSCSLSKAAVTKFAFKRLLSSMQPLMSYSCIHHCKSFTTPLANFRFLTCVSSLMCHQLWFSICAIITKSTFKLSYLWFVNIIPVVF